MEADKRILLVAQKSAETDDPAGDDLYEVGTLAHVLQLLKLPDGTLKVLVEGVSRVQRAKVVERDGALAAEAEMTEAVVHGAERRLAAVTRSLMALFEQRTEEGRGGQ